MSIIEIPNFKYQFDAGPMPKNELRLPPKKGNCRFAVQYYFFNHHQLYFPPEDMLCPKLFTTTGHFVTQEDEILERHLEMLQPSDIIFAQRIRNRRGETVDRQKNTFPSEEDWITSLHTAIFIGNRNIWHATAFEGQSCVWPVETFLDYYKPIAVKRILF